MALTVATNTGALMAQAAASSVNKEMENAMERLSTGKRINSASDDAAGVAIASRLTAEIRGTNQAIRNAMDGQALLDTAEGAHIEVENILQRMRELAVQGSNGTNDLNDRQNTQAEMDQLRTEIDRIAQTTTWAGQNLLDGALSGKATSHGDMAKFIFQVGSGTTAQDSIVASIGAVTADALGVGGSTSRPTVSNVTATGAGVTASAMDANGKITLGGTPANGNKITLNVNGTAHELTVSNADKYEVSVAGVAAQLADELNALGLGGVSVTADATGVTFNAGASVGTPVVTLSSSASNSSGTTSIDTTNDRITIGGSFGNGNKHSVEIAGTKVEITASNTDQYDDSVAGLMQQMSDAINALVDADSTLTSGKFNQGLSATFDATNNRIDVAQTRAMASVQASTTTGKITFATGTPHEVTFADGLTTGDTITMQINGMDFSQQLNVSGYANTKGAGNAALIAAKINEKSEEYGVTAAASAGKVTLTALTGTSLLAKNLATATSTAKLAEGTGANAGKFTVTGTSAVNDTFDMVIDGTAVSVKVISDGYAESATGVASQIAQAVKDADIRGLEVTDNQDGTFNLKKTGSLDVTSTAAAQLTVEFIDAAIQTINSQRADLGAISNRLDSTVNNLTNISSNLQAGRGRIEDADFAAETTSLAKSQILQQASTAMLAQANASKQNVLSLLQG
jgi:flagellin